MEEKRIEYLAEFADHCIMSDIPPLQHENGDLKIIGKRTKLRIRCYDDGGFYVVANCEGNIPLKEEEKTDP